MQGSSVLQQSMHDMQNIQSQRSFYSDPLCNFYSFLFFLTKLVLIYFSYNIITKPFSICKATSKYKCIFSITYNSFSSSKYINIAEQSSKWWGIKIWFTLSKFGTIWCSFQVRFDSYSANFYFNNYLSIYIFIYSYRLQTQMFDASDPYSYMSSLTPIQGLPGAAQLDMNVSCLFMHEVKSISNFLFLWFQL